MTPEKMRALQARISELENEITEYVKSDFEKKEERIRTLEATLTGMKAARVSKKKKKPAKH